MNEVDVQDILRRLAEQGLTLEILTAIAVGLVLMPLLIYGVWRLLRRPRPPETFERWERPRRTSEPPRIGPEPAAPASAAPAPRPVPARAVPPPAAPVARAAAPPPVHGPHVPEDSVLRRHFFGQTRLILETLRPAPADSVLRRHHGQWLCAELEATGREEPRLRNWTAAFEAQRRPTPSLAPAGNPTEPARTSDQPRAREVLPAGIPGDAVLRRHFYAHIRTMLDAVGPPPASDAVLDMIARDESRLGRLQADYDTWRAARLRQAPAAAASPRAPRPHAAPARGDGTARIPEDSVLRRHCLARVRAALEGPGGQPADSVLRRHHEQWLDARMEEILADPARLSRLLDQA